MGELNDILFLKTIATNSVLRLYQEQQILIEQSGLEVSKYVEISKYLSEELRDNGFDFLSVHCDYTKSMTAQKTLIYRRSNEETPSKHGIRPDTIIHVPNNAHNNYVAFEFKESDGNSQYDDFQKLKGLTDQSENATYKYKLGVAVKFTLPEPTFNFFVNGEEVKIDG